MADATGGIAQLLAELSGALPSGVRPTQPPPPKPPSTTDAILAQLIAGVNKTAGATAAFVQPSINLAGQISDVATGAVNYSIAPILRAMLGERGGQLMADTASPMIAGMGMPEMPEGAVRIPRMVESYRAPIETPNVRRGTSFLGEAEPRFHGTQAPISTVLSPQVASAKSNLYGPGFYTTDNLSVAEGYASGARVGLPESGPKYRVYEINPNLKLLHAEKPIPENVLQKLGERYGNVDDWMQRITKRDPEHPGKNFFDPPYGLEQPQLKDFPMTLEDFMQRERFRLASRGKTGLRNKQGWEVAPTPEQVTKELFDALKKEGYGGIEHTGGKIMGGEPHRVKIYWNPDRDIRIRPMDEPKKSFNQYYYGGRDMGEMQPSKIPPPAIEPSYEKLFGGD